MGLHYAVASDDDRSALAPILAHCFGFPAEEAPDWFARAAHENVRALQHDGKVIAGLLTIPMGQFFGGRSVPMVGIAGVGVSPEARGSGVASSLMRELVREARSTGFALSALYPATVPLYSGAGYARAGARYEIAVAPHALATRSRKLHVRRIESADDRDVHTLYANFASQRNGFLDRGPYVWARVFKPRKSAVEGFKAIGEHGCEGYVVLKHTMGADKSEVMATDFVATTREGAERLLDLMAGYGSIATTVRWFGAAPDLLTSVLRERRHDIRVTDYWMLRVCDVERALAGRGYATIDGDLDLEVVDDVIPENNGRFRLRVRGGEASIERGGTGAFRIDVRGLAALYSGFHDARTLHTLGELHASPTDLTIADTLFAGRAPTMSDFF